MKKLKKIVCLIFGIAASLICLSSCGQNDVKTIKIALYGADDSETWNVWAWKELGDNDENYDSKGWPGGSFQLTNTDENGCKYTSMMIDTTCDLGILFVSSTGNKQTSDINVPKSVLQSTGSLYFTFATMAYYTNFGEMSGIQSASISSANGNVITAKLVSVKTPEVSDFNVKNSEGTELTVSSVSMTGLECKITLSGGDISKIPYTLSYNGTERVVNISSSIIDSTSLTYSGNDLGLSLADGNAVFKSWSPTASSVKLLLFKDSGNLANPEKIFDMQKSDSGVWTYTLTDYSPYKYYKYRIEVNGTTYDVADIWAKVGSVDSVASQIIGIDDATCIPSDWESDYKNPFGNTKTETKNYSDAIIYEMHIRDWSKAIGKDGKFINLAESDKFINHLKDIGITHIQILPSFDYAQKNSDSNYNWGYNPYNYNVPEGRYVQNMKDGSDAVKQFRQFIKAVHDAGIAVNMDVVYNHTAGTGVNSLYDMTVPEYFYRITSSGSYSNGSGCGNEIATNHKMVKKFVIDSLKHWMNDYHINGFRFDLMGLHEVATMQEICSELYKIDPNVMVYGEPWTGGTAAVVDGCSGANKANGDGIGIGAFDDDFRNAVKGAEFGGFKQGHVQGKFDDEKIVTGLLGGSTTRNKTGIPGLALHYVECHDNYTLFDKLAISYLNKTSYSGDLFNAIGENGLEAVRAQNKLAAAYIFLSQGTPFINGGQEFLRTKRGNENSYESNDSINAIDLSFKEKYADVYNVYKGLIALRKANPSAFGANTSAKAAKLADGVTEYTTGDFLVYFNASDSEYSIKDRTSAYTKLVDVTSGTPAENTTIPEKVEAKSFVILKK